MTDNISALIAEARGWVSYMAVADHPVSAHDTIRRLADALEAEHEVAEDRFRNFVTVKNNAIQALGERDHYRAALEEARGALDNFGAHTARVQSAKRIIARAMNENGAD